MTNIEDRFRSSAVAACREWGYPSPDAGWYERVQTRLPGGLRALFVHGFESDLLRFVDGFRFTMRDLPAGKGPYALYSKSKTRVPVVNWEYVVQAVDYVRVHETLAPKGYRIGVEDHLMDVTVRDGTDQLLWYIESKEKAVGLNRLVRAMRRWGERGIDSDLDDRHIDALRKAKYLTQHRPPYFSGSAIGLRLDFSVAYIDDDHFALREDAVPFI
jgi:hypothetical protein